MSFTRCVCNGFWPYEEGTPIVHYEHVMNLDGIITLPEGIKVYCGNVERIVDAVNVAVIMIYYTCDTIPHTHAELPSCNRYIKCYQRHGRRKG